METDNQSRQPGEKPFAQVQPSLDPEKKDIEDNKIVAALSYLNILFLIPLFLKRDSAFCQFHAKQGLVMLIIFLLGGAIFWIPLFGWLLWILVVVADIVALIKALQGERYEIPVVGDWAKKINL
jgi:fumarate reductase subunit D